MTHRPLLTPSARQIAFSTFLGWAAVCALASLGPAAELAAPPSKPAGKANAWTALFDGKSLDGWKSTDFGGQGEVRAEEGRIKLEFGATLTGLTYQQEFPKQNYELRLEAMRVDGNDFFCGLTFPVAESHCSLIVGGWAGAVVGLSSIDGRDASENDTTRIMKFEAGRWYRIRVRVTAARIQAWIDDQPVVDQDIRKRRVATRVEVDLSKPLGIAAWQTRAALRAIEYRRLADAEK